MHSHILNSSCCLASSLITVISDVVQSTVRIWNHELNTIYEVIDWYTLLLTKQGEERKSTEYRSHLLLGFEGRDWSSLAPQYIDECFLILVQGRCSTVAITLYFSSKLGTNHIRL